jgi:hypothetical protein
MNYSEKMVDSHSATSQKIVIFMVTDTRSSDPKNLDKYNSKASSVTEDV